MPIIVECTNSSIVILHELHLSVNREVSLQNMVYDIDEEYFCQASKIWLGNATSRKKIIKANP